MEMSSDLHYATAADAADVDSDHTTPGQLIWLNAGKDAARDNAFT